MRTRDKVAIGWISPGVVDTKFAMSIATIYAERHSRIGALLSNENSGLLARGRNEVVYQFLTQCHDSQWLLMLDADEWMEVPAFDRLIAAAHETERPIVAGVYFGAWAGDPYPFAVPLIFRSVPGTTTFKSIHDYPENQVIEIDAAGTGCLLVHRSVLEKFQADATPHQGDRWCWFQDMPINGAWFSEDHWFCARAREMGYQLYAHTGVQLQHRKKFWLSERHHDRTAWETPEKEATDERERAAPVGG